MSRLFTYFIAGLLLYAAPVAAEPSDLIDIGDLPGGSVSAVPRAISVDGLVVAGRGTSASGLEAFRWESGTGMVGLGDLAGGIFSSDAIGISGDGSVIVGFSSSASGYQAFRWTSGTGMVGLGDLAGGSFSSQANGISTDGSTIVGVGRSASGLEAFRWTSGTGMIGLGDLAGGSFRSWANGVNDDGSVIVGYSISANGNEAFRWTSGGGMVGLGDLAGGTFSSNANSVSGDGLVVVGYSVSANGSEAFRWTSGTGMIGLGDLAGGSFYSQAKAVNADGSVIVGQSSIASGNAAFIWDQGNGMRELNTVLSDLGVDTSNWTLTEATGVNSNGERVIGYGNYMGGSAAFLAVVSDTIGGLTTAEALAQSLVDAPRSGQQATALTRSGMNHSLFLARNAFSYFPQSVTDGIKKQTESPAEIEPAAGERTATMNGRYFAPEKWAFYSIGSLAMGQNNNPHSNSADGAAGVLYRADENWVVGGGMIAGHNHIDLTNGGNNTLTSSGAEILISYNAPNKVRLYMTGFGSYLTLDSSRGYMNGSGRSYSYGDTHGYGYGAAARLGYEIENISGSNITMMPYFEAEYSKTKLDSYAEEKGPFPAVYSDQSGERVVGRLGLELSHDLSENLAVHTRAAYARRLHDHGNTVTASSTGVTLTLDPEKEDRQWAEGGVSLLWRAEDNVHVSADVSGRSGRTGDPYLRGTLGLTVGF